MAKALDALLDKANPPASVDEAGGESDVDKLRSLAEEAFGKKLSEDQFIALKEFVHGCVGSDY